MSEYNTPSSLKKMSKAIAKRKMIKAKVKAKLSDEKRGKFAKGTNMAKASTTRVHPKPKEYSFDRSHMSPAELHKHYLVNKSRNELVKKKIAYKSNKSSENANALRKKLGEYTEDSLRYNLEEAKKNASPTNMDKLKNSRKNYIKTRYKNKLKGGK